MRPFRDSRKTLFAFPCFLEGRVCVHTACVCLQVCVCVSECAVRVCGTLSGRTVFPREGSRGRGGGLDIALHTVFGATASPLREETQS